MSALRALSRAASGGSHLRTSARWSPHLSTFKPTLVPGPAELRAFSTTRAHFAPSPFQTAKEWLSARKAARRRAIALKGAKYGGFLVGSTCLGLITFIGVIFIHDAFTYTTKHVDRVPVSPLALHPELGGPKNLPVARVLIDDDEVRAGLRVLCPKCVSNSNQSFSPSSWQT